MISCNCFVSADAVVSALQLSSNLSAMVMMYEWRLEETLLPQKECAGGALGGSMVRVDALDSARHRGAKYYRTAHEDHGFLY
jgi:hypothetical protein